MARFHIFSPLVRLNAVITPRNAGNGGLSPNALPSMKIIDNTEQNFQSFRIYSSREEVSNFYLFVSIICCEETVVSCSTLQNLKTYYALFQIYSLTFIMSQNRTTLLRLFTVRVTLFGTL